MLIFKPLYFTLIMFMILFIKILNIFKIIPCIFADNLNYVVSDLSEINNINFGEQQSSPEPQPDIIINDNSILVEAELFPNIELIKEEYDEKIKKLIDDIKKLERINKSVITEYINITLKYKNIETEHKNIETKYNNIKIKYNILLYKYKREL
jgi:chromosome segregation ATPase